MIENLLSVSTQVLILFILIGLGFLCAKKAIFTEASIKNLTNFVLYFVTPCVVIASFHRDFDSALAKKLITCAVVAVFQHGLNILLAHTLIRDKNDGKRIAMQYAVVFSNCGYMALPLQSAILGSEGVFLGAAYICVFNLLCWTYGLVVMSGDIHAFSGKKLILNPGVIGVAVGLVLFLTPLKLPAILLEPVNHLSALNTPLPMVIIGFYLAQITSFKFLKDPQIVFTMLLRLVITPAIGFVIMKLCHLDSAVITSMVIASCAPCAANTTMFSAKYNRDTQTAVTLVTMSTLFSIITMPLLVSFAMQ